MKPFVLIGLFTLAFTVKLQAQAKYTLDDFAAMSIADAANALNTHGNFGVATFADLARAALHSKRMDLIALCLSDNHLGPNVYELTPGLPQSAFRDRVQVMMLNSVVLWGPDAIGGGESVEAPSNEAGPRDVQIPKADVSKLSVGPLVSGTGLPQGITRLIMGPSLEERANTFGPLVKKYLPSVVLTGEMLKTSAARSKLAADLTAVMPKEPAALTQPSPQTGTTPQVLNDKTKVDAAALNSAQAIPLVKKAPSTSPISTPNGEPASSTPWSIIVVLIVAACGLLWLLVKKRK